MDLQMISNRFKMVLKWFEDFFKKFLQVLN